MRKSYINLIGAILLLIVVAGGYIYWYQTLESVQSETSMRRSELASDQAAASASVAASNELASLGESESAVESYFVDPANVVPFLETLQNIGTAENATVDVQSVTTEASPRSHLDLSLTVTGSFEAVMRTVGAIEYAPYDITANSLTLTSVSAANTAPWQADMTFSVSTASSTPGTTSVSVPTTSTSASTTQAAPGPAFTSIPATTP